MICWNPKAITFVRICINDSYLLNFMCSSYMIYSFRLLYGKIVFLEKYYSNVASYSQLLHRDITSSYMLHYIIMNFKKRVGLPCVFV